MTSEILINGKFAIKKFSALLNENLAGQQILENVRLEDIRIEADNEWLYAIIVVSGRYDGPLVVKFNLRTSESSPDLIIEHIQVSLKGNGVLKKVANCMLKVFITERMEAKVQALLHKSFAAMLNDMTAKYGVIQVEEFTLKSDLADYNFKQIGWDETHLTCTFYASGVLSVLLE